VMFGQVRRMGQIFVAILAGVYTKEAGRATAMKRLANEVTESWSSVRMHTSYGVSCIPCHCSQGMESTVTLTPWLKFTYLLKKMAQNSLFLLGFQALGYLTGG